MAGSNVTLFAYDLTGGLARTMSQAIIGKQIDGVWHTSVVVYGQEYFYGGGICVMPIKTTPYGTPVQELNLGSTTKSSQEFLDFLSAINSRFTMEGYHLLNHNCNHFTEECLRFLVGQSVPLYVKNQAAELLSTPMGKTFEPMINSMMNMMGTGQVQTVQTHFDHVSHEDLFAEFTKIGLFNDLDEFSKEGGLVVYWDPQNETSFELPELLGEFSAFARIGCVDCLRAYYLKPEQVPSFQIYIEGELVYSADSVEELRESKEVIQEMMGAS